MKGNLFMTAAVIAAAACWFSGCTGTEETRFRTVGEKASYALAEGGRDSVKIDISLQFPDGWAGKDAAESVSREIVADALGEDFCGMAPEDAVRAFIDDKVRDYRETNLDFAAELSKDGDGQDIDGWGVLSWEYSVYGRYEGEYGGRISYSVTSYVYIGGAHGGTTLLGLNFDRKTGDVLSEDDVFTFGYGEKLSNALRAHLKSSLDEEDYDMLFTTDISPNGNFILDKTGVTYIYGQYEIGPYAVGIIKVTVPWNEIQDILK